MSNHAWQQISNEELTVVGYCGLFESSNKERNCKSDLKMPPELENEPGDCILCFYPFCSTLP